MTDGQLLLAVFTAFYLTECLHWMPLGSTVLSSFAMRRGWSARRPSATVAGRGYGLAVAWPLPPLGSFLVVQSWPVIPDLEGLWIGAGQADEGRRIAWAEVVPRLDQRTVQVAAHVFVKCESKRAAMMLMTFLQQPRAGRKKAVEEFWRTSLSLPAARAATRRYRLATASLRMTSIVVFLLCFLWLPFLFWRFSGDTLRLLVGFLSLLLANTFIAFTWRRLDQRLFPALHKRRWPQVLHLMFMPAHTIRAHDLIGLEILAGLHPLVAASCVLKREAMATLASETWRGWKYRSATDSLRAASTVVLPKLHACCTELGFTLSDLEAPPLNQGGAQSYCPRCHAQFTVAETTCEQCGGMATKGW